MKFKATLADKTFDIVNIFLCMLISIATVYPFYYIIMYTVSDPSLAYKGTYLHPQGFSLYVYRRLLAIEGLPLAFAVSIFRTVTGTVAAVFSNALMAYIFTRRNYRFRKVLYRFTVVTMYLNAGLIPWYLVVRGVGLKDSFLVYILPSMMSAFNIILVKTFIEQLPASVEESAKIDGAGVLTIFTKVIFPMILPIIATISVFIAVGQWNSWFDTMIFISSKKLYTAQFMLYTYLTQVNNVITALNSSNGYRDAGIAAKQITPKSVQLAITVVVLIPIMIVYPFMQRFFVKGIALGAVKE